MISRNLGTTRTGVISLRTPESPNKILQLFNIIVISFAILTEKN